MKSSLLFSALMALTLASGLSLPARAQATAPIIIKQGEVTLRVTEIAWKPYAEFTPRDPSRVAPAPAQVLTLSFTLEGVPPTRRRFVAESSVRVYALAPDGRRIEAERVSPTQRVWNDWPAIDPRWKTLQLQFDWFPPDFQEQKLAPEIVQWADVPVPTASDAPQPLPGGARQIVTDSGVRVRLDSSMLRVRPDDPTPTARFFGSWLPPLDDASVCAEIGEVRGANRRDAITFDNGAPIQDRTHHINVSAGREVNKRDETPGTFTLSAPLREGAKTASLQIEIRRLKARTNATPAGAVGFTTELPMPRPADVVVTDNFVAQHPLGTGVLKLSPLKYSPEDDWELSWRGQILQETMGDTTENGDPVNWISTAVNYSAPGGFNGQTGLRIDGFWRDNGAALQANQSALQAVMQFSARKDVETPTTATIKTDWEKVRTSDFTLKFADLPVPTPGQIIDIEKTLDAGEFGSFTLRKIGYFTAEQPLSPQVGARLQKFQPPYGLAVVVEHTPSARHGVSSWTSPANFATWKLAPQDARDSRGGDLLRNCDVPAANRAVGLDELERRHQRKMQPRRQCCGPHFIFCPPRRAPRLSSFRCEPSAARFSINKP